MSRTLVLNAGWMPINVVSAFDAVCDVFTGRAKCLDTRTFVTHDFESWVQNWEDAVQEAKQNEMKVISTGSLSLVLPEVVVLVDYKGLGPKASHRRPKFSRTNIYRRDKNTCFTAGTLVLMADGRQIPIEDVCKGDRIIDAYGNPQTVVMTGRRWADDVREMSRRGSALKTGVTPEHPYLSSIGEFKPIGEWEIVDGRQRGKGDYLVFPRKVRYELPDAGYVDVSRYLPDGWFRYRSGRVYWTRRPHENGFPAVLSVTPELAYLMGLYCAEGSTSNSTVNLSFSMDERHTLAAEAKVILESYGLNVSIDEKPEKDTCVVRTGSKTLATILLSACGHGSHNKRAPWEFIGKYRAEFFRGLVRGDGYIRDDKIVLSMASFQMIRDAQSISWGLGLFPTFQCGERPDGRKYWSLFYQGGNFTKIAHEVLDHEASRNEPVFGNGEFVFSKLKGLSEIDGAMVFNMEVGGTNSYIANGVAVHNCQYCGHKFKTEDLELEHVVPKSQGGMATWMNIVLACTPCNRKKDNKTPKQAGMRLIREPRIPKASELGSNPLERLRKKVGSKPLKTWEQFIGKMYWEVELT